MATQEQYGPRGVLKFINKSDDENETFQEKDGFMDSRSAKDGGEVHKERGDARVQEREQKNGHEAEEQCPAGRRK